MKFLSFRRDGRSRAGVYCAANACIEQVIQHGEVDIFQAVKTVRRNRPQLVENITEYKYGYDLVLHYVLHYLEKDLKDKDKEKEKEKNTGQN
uniref:Tyrosine specific protein phosphatases domain-containing protein n=1 Tax=Phlebotomus papatasi TaxID=29031 RepID=A0A1B0GQG5_PHLPP